MTDDEHIRSRETGALVAEGRSLLDGKLYGPLDVPLGKECGCVCPTCGQPLIARQCRNSNVVPHFAHEPGADCAAAVETETHLAAKQLIEKTCRLFFPRAWAELEVRDATGQTHRRSRLVKNSGVRTLTHVAIEHRLGDVRPDLLVRTDDLGEVLVEIVVTNPVSADKLEKVKRLGLPLVEYNLAKLRGASVDALGQALFDSSELAKWRYHPEMEQAEQCLRAELQPTLERQQQRRDDWLAQAREAEAAAAAERARAQELRQQRNAALRAEEARAAAFKRLTTPAKTRVLCDYLREDRLPELLRFHIQNENCIDVPDPLLWQTALLIGLQVKLRDLWEKRPEQVTVNWGAAFLAARFPLTQEYRAHGREVVREYLNLLERLGVLVSEGDIPLSISGLGLKHKVAREYCAAMLDIHTVQAYTVNMKRFKA